MDASAFAWSLLAGGWAPWVWSKLRDAPLLRARLAIAQKCFPSQRPPTRHRTSNPTKMSLGCPRWTAVVAPTVLTPECSSHPIPSHHPHPILSSRRSQHQHHPDGGQPSPCCRRFGEVAMASAPKAHSMRRLPTSSSRCAGRQLGDMSCKDRASTRVCASASEKRSDSVTEMPVSKDVGAYLP